ncbi:hypothetical protein Vafri_931 [Volvox africanus]|nr:hypothetical protein Vafri_931 [Volvox africanus]
MAPAHSRSGPLHAMRIRLGTILTGFSLLLAGVAIVLLYRTTFISYPSPKGSKLSELDKTGSTALLKAVAVAGMQCSVQWGVELWGDALVWGDLHHTESEAECCAACYEHRSTAARGGLDKGTNSSTCNTWVFCADPQRCGNRYGECWLKHHPALPPADAPLAVGNTMWNAGIVYDDAVVAQAYEKYLKLTMHTKLGDIVVTLMPELAPNVVREIRREVLAIAQRGNGCGNCKFYRAEDFGIQGVILSPGCYIGTPDKGHPNGADPNRKIPPGYVCRAGMAGSAHFFINFFEAEWGDALCWGRVDDLSLAKVISKRPIKVKATPNELSMLADELSFSMTLSQ